MLDQENIDTAPVVLWDNSRVVTFESIEVDPGERAEIILSPKVPLRRPVLFMSLSVQTGKLTIEEATHGRSPIFTDNMSIDNFHFGRQIDAVVTSDEPIKIVMMNLDGHRNKVGASLVASEDLKTDCPED